MSFQERRPYREEQKGPGIYEKCGNYIQQRGNLKEAEMEKLLEFLEKIGEDLAREVKMAQLRRLLDAFEKLKSAVRTRKGLNIREETQILKIHLAYAAGRERALRPLEKLLASAIDKVRDEEDFKRLSQLIEGLIAYHKFYGGGD